MMKTLTTIFAATFILLVALAVSAQTTAFNYQGKLTDAGTPQANYQMQFKLLDAAVGGTQIGSTISNNSVAVANGVFSVLLDFGTNVFTGADRFLEISVRRNINENYTILAPRQQIASSPYSIRTLSAQQADTALNAQKLGGVAASEYVTNSNVGSSFIRNGTNQQTADFNVSGNGLIGGNVGIGTTNPLGKLHVIGDNMRYQTPNGKIMDFSSGSVLDIVARNTGLAISSSGAGNDNNVYLNPNAGNGNVTVGTFAPISKFTVGTSSASYGFTHTDGGIIVGSYINSLGGWFGTKTNHSLHFFANDSLPLATLTSQGRFGIGTRIPQSGLELRGIGTQTQQRITDDSSGNSLVLQGGAGGNMKVTGYNYNTNTAVPLYLSTDGANTILNFNGGNVGIGTTTPSSKLDVAGNVTQIGSGYGFPKAMIYVRGDTPAMILRCYNGVTGSSSGNCGFSVNRYTIGGYGVNLGFPVASRFVYVTTGNSYIVGCDNVGGRFYFPGSSFPNNINVFTFCTTDPNDTKDSDFMIIVF